MTVAATLLVGQDPNQRKSFTAGEDLEAYRLVILGTDPTTVEYPSAQFATGIVGITLHAAESGKPVDIAMGGFALLKVDGAAANIAVGDSIVAHDNTGLGQKAAGGAAANRVAIGRAMAASTVDGDLIPIAIGPHTVYFAS
jgi:hypothetical protein